LNYTWFNGSTQVGTGTIYTATTAGNYTVEVSNASGCKATSQAVSVTVTVINNMIPVVSITSPGNNASFVAPANFTVTTMATDGDGTISKVELYDGTTLLGTALTSPYSFALANLAAGTYTLTAKATDNFGAEGTSSVVTITVSANQSSVITIVSPTNNSTVNGTSVTIDVTATDPDGSITKVEYLDNGIVVGTSTTQPYTVTLDNLTTGTHVITVRVTDSNGGETTSDPITVTVNSASGILSGGYKVFTGIFPNPSVESFKVTSTGKIKTLRIKNMYGMEMEAWSNMEEDQTTEIGRDLSEGTYFAVIEYASGTIEVAKLIKLK
jgi:hypothetical protein